MSKARAVRRWLSPGSLRAAARLSAPAWLWLGVPACTSSPPPFIGAAVATLSTGSDPSAYRSSALVAVLNPESGDPVGDALVTINGVILGYNSSDSAYEGDVPITRGAAVALVVSSDGRRYTVEATEFTTYPAITAPQTGSSWAQSCSIPVQWSAGAPTTAPAVNYALGVLDAANPNGGTVWPAGGEPAEEPITSTEAAVPANVLTIGDKLLLVGITSQQPISGAEPRSMFLLGAFSYLPVSVTQTADSPVSIAVGPERVPIERGTTQQFTATGMYCDGRMVDLGQTVAWTSSDPGVATIDDHGLALGVAAGTTEISARAGSISGSLAVTVTRHWVSQPSPVSGKLLQAVTWTGDGFVAVGEYGTILTSPDGATWTLQASGTNADLTAIGASGGRLVAAESGSNTVLTSPDGVNWTPHATSDSVLGLAGVAGSGTQFVAVGQTTSSGSAVLTSPDGVTWTAQDAGVSSRLASVVWSGTQFVAVGDGIVTSSDGVTWTARTIPSDRFFLTSVAWSGTQFVAADGNYAAILTSPDGATWTVQGCEVGYGFRGVAASSDTIVAVGPPQGIFTSSDGKECISNRIDTPFTFWAVSWSGTQFVVVGAYGTILTSP